MLIEDYTFLYIEKRVITALIFVKLNTQTFFYFIMFFNKLFFLLCLLVLVTFVILNKNSSRILKTIQVSYSDDIPIKRLPKAIIIGSPKCGLF